MTTEFISRNHIPLISCASWFAFRPFFEDCSAWDRRRYQGWIGRRPHTAGYDTTLKCFIDFIDIPHSRCFFCFFGSRYFFPFKIFFSSWNEGKTGRVSCILMDYATIDKAELRLLIVRGKGCVFFFPPHTSQEVESSLPPMGFIIFLFFGSCWWSVVSPNSKRREKTTFLFFPECAGSQKHPHRCVFLCIYIPKSRQGGAKNPTAFFLFPPYPWGSVSVKL